MQVKLARDAQEDIFQRRASEVDSEPQGKEGPPGSLRLPEDDILQGHISLDVGHRSLA